MRGVKKLFKGRNSIKKENKAVGVAQDSASASSSITASAAAAASGASAESQRREGGPPILLVPTATPRTVTALTESSADSNDDVNTSYDHSTAAAGVGRKSMEASAANQVTIASAAGESSAANNNSHADTGTTGCAAAATATRRTALKQVNEESEREIILRDLEAEEDSPRLVMSYNAVPVLEQIKLPRGGVSVDTKAVGRVQVRTWVFVVVLYCLLLPRALVYVCV
jgi:hypothetical protein